MQQTPRQGSTHQRPIFNNKYEIMQSLGEGNTSKVYLARDLQTHDFCALKVFKDEYLNRSDESVKQIQSEINILQSLQHNNIV